MYSSRFLRGAVEEEQFAGADPCNRPLLPGLDQVTVLESDAAAEATGFEAAVCAEEGPEGVAGGYAGPAAANLLG